MSLLSLIVVLLIEQFRPLDYRRIVGTPLMAWADWVADRFNGGRPQHGQLAWAIAVPGPVLLLFVAYWLLDAVSPLLGWLLTVGILYLTMGFRQFSHHYSEIELALRLGEIDRARALLGEWQGVPTDAMDAREIARRAIRGALQAAHRHVFAVILWFVILPGPCGAALYRLALIVRERWQLADFSGQDQFSRFSTQVFGIIDWIPARATAFAFAIVGDFEDAIHCWRAQAAQWSDRNLGIVLAGGAGALGVNLGESLVEEGEVSDRQALGLGDPPDVHFMQSAVGLVWRATVLWMLLLFLSWLARLVG